MQAIVLGGKDHSVANKALEEYRDTQMPYLPRIQSNDRQQHIKKLMSEVARGPISITPVMQRQVRSKLKTRVVQRSEEEQLAASRRLSRKIGGIL